MPPSGRALTLRGDGLLNAATNGNAPHLLEGTVRQAEADAQIAEALASVEVTQTKEGAVWQERE